MNYVESFDLFGIDAKQIPCIKGSGAPTTSTEGAVGCFYMNTDNGDVYKCTAAADGVYTWENAGSNKAILYTEQTLTEEQKAKARANIGATTQEEVASWFGGVLEPRNLLDGATWKAGYIAEYNTYLNDVVPNVITTPSYLYSGEAYTENAIEVEPGRTYNLSYKFHSTVGNGAWWCVCEYKTDGTWTRTVLPLSGGDDACITHKATFTPSENTVAIRLSGRTYAWYDYVEGKYTIDELTAMAAKIAPTVFFITNPDEITVNASVLLPVVTEKDINKTLRTVDGKWVSTPTDKSYRNPNVKSINHRGYCTVAPENTLSAYRLSKQNGFAYAECDVSFTSDGVPVLLHDGTVDRTSNGTGNISTLTFEEVRALDFGSWFSDDFAGERIPSFEEFILLCKKIGLHPYIELKGNVSAENATALVATVKRYGMRGKVTWISFYKVALTNIKNADASARLGYVTENTSEDNITIANELKTDSNEVFIDISYYSLTNDFLSLCVDNDIPIEVWTVNDEDSINALDPYVSGVTSDNLLANVVWYDDNN